MRGGGRALAERLLRPKGPSARSEPEAGPASTSPDGFVFSTKALPRFIDCVVRRAAPVVLDLGPGSGLNVSFFAERLGCKLHVADLFDDLDRLTRQQREGELSRVFERRITRTGGELDGILCWDLFDYLSQPVAGELAQALVRALRPGGALLGLFASGTADSTCFTRYGVIEGDRLRHDRYAAAARKRPPVAGPVVDRWFAGLVVAHSFLLTNQLRELVFRKPAAGRSAAAPRAPSDPTR